MSIWDSLFRLMFGRRGAAPTPPRPPSQPSPQAAPAPPPFTPAPASPHVEASPPEKEPPLAEAAPLPPPVIHHAPAPETPSTPPAEVPLNRYRLAKSLEKLRAQVNSKFPQRSKLSDGWIGDAAHASRESDHNPWIIDGDTRVVSALDLTNDMDHCRGRDLVDALVASRDPRIKYLIFEGKIVKSYERRGVPAWTWAAYTGANRHDKHFHLSVVEGKDGYDDERDWPI